MFFFSGMIGVSELLYLEHQINVESYGLYQMLKCSCFFAYCHYSVIICIIIVSFVHRIVCFLDSAALSGIGNIACFATQEDDPYISSKGEVKESNL